MKVRSALLLCAAALAAALLAGCAGGSSSAAPTAQPTAAPTAAPTEAPTPQPTAETLPVSREGETEYMPATRLTSPLGFTLLYAHEAFTPEEGENSLTLWGQQVDYLPEYGMSITRSEQNLQNTLEELRSERDFEEIEDTFGAGEYPATLLHSMWKEDGMYCVCSHYVTQQNDAVYVVTIYYPMEMAEGWAAWMYAMMNSIEFTV